MFIPNEIITEILNDLDYQTWKDKVNKINQQYHSYYCHSCDGILGCKKHGLYVANWRYNFYHDENKYIYPICVNSENHNFKCQMIRDIELPHNY